MQTYKTRIEGILFTIKLIQATRKVKLSSSLLHNLEARHFEAQRREQG